MLVHWPAEFHCTWNHPRAFMRMGPTAVESDEGTLHE
jgi:hypothetical protein